MALIVSPNKKDSAFIQRNDGNTAYDQINISGSDVIFYHSSSGELVADKISIWTSQYGIPYNINAGTVTISSPGTTTRIITFNRPMTNNNYVVILTPNASATGLSYIGKTINGFTASFAATYTGNLDFMAMPSTQ